VIPADAPAEQFLRTAQPAAISCWQQLDAHLGTVSSIGRIATSFGPRGDFAVFDEYALSEGSRVSDTAIFCTSGPLEYDSAIFLRGTGIHRASLVQGQPEAERRRRSALALPRVVRQRMGPAEFGVAGLRRRRGRQDARTAAAEKPV